MQQTIKPLIQTERENFFDILRGLAILGIFIANLYSLTLYDPEQTAVGFHSVWDKKVMFLHTMFIEGKFYSIFSLLFGWGIAMQMQRLREKGITGNSFIRRRLWGMLLLGMAHLLILWTGDIVAFYAMLGFMLLLFHKASDKKLLIWGTALILSPILLYFLKMTFQWLNAPAGILWISGSKIEQHWFPGGKDGPFGLTVENTSTWLQVWQHNIAGFFFRYGYLFFVSRIPKVLGVFLLGFYLGRNRNYQRLMENKNLLIKILIAGLVIGLPANYMLAKYMQNEDDYFNLQMNGFYQTVVYAIGVVPLGFAYAAALALMYKAAAGKKILSLLQPVGKMAFTNYILHSLVGVLVFYGVGLGYGKQFGPLAWTIFGSCIFLLQIIFSHIWLSYFRFGPVEWFWRSITYKKWQVMRKQVITEAALIKTGVEM